MTTMDQKEVNQYLLGLLGNLEKAWVSKHVETKGALL